MRPSNSFSDRQQVSLVEPKCVKCDGPLKFDDDFEDMEFVDGRTNILLICKKCDREYNGVFALIRLAEGDNEDIEDDDD